MAFIEVIEKKNKEKKKKPPKVGNQEQEGPAEQAQEDPVNNEELQDEDMDGYSSGEEFLKSQMDSASNVMQKETRGQLAWMEENKARPPQINWDDLPIQDFDDFDPDDWDKPKKKDQVDQIGKVDKCDPKNYRSQDDIQEEMEWNQFLASIDLNEQIALGHSYADAI